MQCNNLRHKITPEIKISVHSNCESVSLLKIHAPLEPGTIVVQLNPNSISFDLDCFSITSIALLLLQLHRSKTTITADLASSFSINLLQRSHNSRWVSQTYASYNLLSSRIKTTPTSVDLKKKKIGFFSFSVKPRFRVRYYQIRFLNYILKYLYLYYCSIVS